HAARRRRPQGDARVRDRPDRLRIAQCGFRISRCIPPSAKCIPHSALRIPQSEIEMDSHYFYSQRLKLHYVDWGNADKPPLLLVHGGRDHCRSWDWAAADLRRDFHVIAPDLRGHGDSAWAVGSAYSMIDYVLDVAALLKALDLFPITVIAHSLGASVALQYAGVYPEDVARLVAI